MAADCCTAIAEGLAALGIGLMAVKRISTVTPIDYPGLRTVSLAQKIGYPWL